MTIIIDDHQSNSKLTERPVKTNQTISSNVRACWAVEHCESCGDDDIKVI